MSSAVYKSLNEVVKDALKLHASYDIPELKLGNPTKRLVIASGNALPTGKIIFSDDNAVFADEGQYVAALKTNPLVDSAVVISASGTKHAPMIIKYLLDQGLETFLLTCDRKSEAAQLLAERQGQNHVVATKSNVEPVTYNTSTYLGMILTKTREDPQKILAHIQQNVDPTIPANLGGYNSFYIMVPPEFDIIREMFMTKFDELFGARINGRCYTSEQSRHGKTVVPSDDEMFISLGLRNELFGDENARWNVPLFEGAGYAAAVAIGYYVIGKIQEQKPGYFKKHVDIYKALQKDKLFDDAFFNSKVKRYEVKTIQDN